MTPLATIKEIVASERLFVSGIVTDALPEGAKSLLLLSPDEPAFWEWFTESPEYSDGDPDPMNRWSEAAMVRIIPQIPGATAFFPFGGPPWHPFIGWALASGRVFSSPVQLLAHETAGLFVSYRAALALPYALAQEQAVSSPCLPCDAPCVSACPIDAFASGSYDVPACKAHISTSKGAECHTNGCLVRRACPIGQTRRLPEQSAFHMKAFHPDGP